MAAKPPSMVKALDDALRAQRPAPEDRAAVVLAKHYAALIDSDPTAILKVGHMVLPVLTALGLTPASRGGSQGKPPSAPDAPSYQGSGPGDALARLRAIHGTRQA